MEHTNRTSKSDFWNNHIEQCRQSGMSQRKYCEVHNLALSTFGYWKRKTSQKTKEKIQFYPLVVPDSTNIDHNSGLTLNLKDERFRIEVGTQFSQSALKNLIITLEQL